MHRLSHLARDCFALIACASVSGCAERGAPSFTIFGAFFPAWILLAIAGIAAAFGARAFFVAQGLGQAVPLQLPVCTAIGVIVGVSCWFLWFAL